MRVHHVAFRTRDIERLQRFYEHVLGLRVIRRNVHENGTLRSTWLAAGNAVLMLERAEEHEPMPPSGGMDLIAFAVDAADRSSIEARLAGANVAIEARTEFTWYVRDPDGRRIGLSTFRFEP